MPDVADAVGGPVALELCAVLMRPRGCGRLVLRSTDPGEQPAIELAFTADERDRRRLRNAVRLSLELSADMRPVARAVTGLERPWITSDQAVDAYVRQHVDSFGHALGTVPMGSAAEDAAVDQRCAVFGVDGLWVVDASVCPAVLAVPPNLTTIMVAERVAEWLAGT